MSCIIIVKTKIKIIAGADSKRTLYRINAETGDSTTSVDNNYIKIHKVNKLYFAVAGFNDGGQLSLATEICNLGKSLNETAQMFKKQMTAIHEDIIELMRAKNNDWYRDRFSSSHVGGTSFFQMQGNEPQIVTVYFDIKNSAEEKTKIVTSERHNSVVTMLGSWCHIGNPSQKNEQTLLESDDVTNMSQIANLIRMEMHHHPDEIGEPLRFLILDKDGDTWLRT